MKIWHIGAAPNPFRVDGVSRTVWLLSTEQCRLGGHDVALILDGAPTPEAHQMADEVGLKLHDLSTGSYAHQVQDLLNTLRPDVVHMHSVFIPRQAVLGKVLRKAGVPYVITPHAGLAPQVLARGRLKKSLYSAVRERPRFMCASAVALVTPAEEKAVRAFIPHYTGIVRWMPNPVEVSMLDPCRWHGVAEQKRLVFLGRFDVLVKGIDILIEIARLLPEVQVDLYGTEDAKTLEWLKKLKENLPPNVSFNDPIFGKAKAEILAGASIYIQPSRWEGFPVSVAECLYLGVPSAIP
jgi:glycosyltransferase involved in cell wall biosynthesis